MLRIIAQLFAFVKRFLYHLYVRQLSPSYVAAHYSKGFKISQALFYCLRVIYTIFICGLAPRLQHRRNYNIGG